MKYTHIVRATEPRLC